MTTPNTPANGGQILTDEQCSEIRERAAINADLWAESQNFEPTQSQVDSIFIRAIEADLRASLAAPAIPTGDRNAAHWSAEEICNAAVKAGLGVLECNSLIVTLKSAAPASVPRYLPPPELTWLYTHCRAIGMTCKSDSGKWEHDIALFTMNLQSEIKAAQDIAQPAAQVAVSEPMGEVVGVWLRHGQAVIGYYGDAPKMGDLVYATPATVKTAEKKPLTHCAASRDGNCAHPECPQLRDNEPHATGRHCPIDTSSEDEQ